MINAINHFTMTIPNGSEEKARSFYCDFLQLKEIEKPEILKKNGGIWFQLPGNIQLHLTIQNNIDPNESKSHLAVEVINLEQIKQQLDNKDISYKEAVKIPHFERINIKDPFGNRIEVMQRTSQN